MGIPESSGSWVKNGDFEALAPGILIQYAWSQGISIPSWVWKPVLSWALEDKCKERHALHFTVLLDFGFWQFGRLGVVGSLRTLWYRMLQLFSCVWLFCDPVDYSPSGSSVDEISQARILEWVAISFSRGSSQPRDLTCIFCFGRWVLDHWAARVWCGTLTCKWKMQRTLFACTAELWETEEESQGLKMKIDEQSWRC